MIIDDRGRLFGKISIVDILVICLILAGIAGAYYKFGKSNTVTPFSRPDKIEVVFFAEDIPEYAGIGIKPGDPAKDRQTNSVFGKVKEVTVGPDIVYFPNKDGQAVKSSKEGYISLTIVTEGEGVYSNNGISFSNMDYYVNKLIEVRFGNTAIYARIQSIRKIEG